MINHPVVHFHRLIHLHRSHDMFLRLRENLDLRSIAFGFAACHHQTQLIVEFKFLEGEHVTTASHPTHNGFSSFFVAIHRLSFHQKRSHRSRRAPTHIFYRVFCHHRSRKWQILAHSDAPMHQASLFEMLVNQHDFRILLWNRLTRFVVHQQEFRRIFIDGKFLELNSQRKFHKPLFVCGAPFGHVGSSLEFHALHVGTSQCCRHDGDKQPNVAKHRW